jgi:serine palmitoyltransferase
MLSVRGVSNPVLNLSSNDFLGLGQLPSFKQTAKDALDKYGCGSCGPRGFYGTIDVHLEFEKKLAAFMGTEVGCLLTSTCRQSVLFDVRTVYHLFV